jgi:hypothetical protein
VPIAAAEVGTRRGGSSVGQSLRQRVSAALFGTGAQASRANPSSNVDLGLGVVVNDPSANDTVRQAESLHHLDRVEVSVTDRDLLASERGRYLQRGVPLDGESERRNPLVHAVWAVQATVVG